MNQNAQHQGMCCEVVKLLSRVQLIAIPWTVACQVPLSMGFSRQEYWSGLPFPSLGDLPNPGIEPWSPALQADALPSEPPTPRACVGLVIVVVQSLSCVQLFATTWIAACLTSLSFTISWSLLKLMSTELVMPSDHLILCCPLLFLPSIFPRMRVFSNELALRIRWPKYCSFSFSISPSNEYSGLISFKVDWFDLLGNIFRQVPGGLYSTGTLVQSRTKQTAEGFNEEHPARLSQSHPSPAMGPKPG